MEKYLIFVIYLIIPFEMVRLIQEKQKKVIIVYLMIIIISIPISILLATGSSITSIATIIAKLLSPIVKSD